MANPGRDPARTDGYVAHPRLRSAAVRLSSIAGLVILATAAQPVETPPVGRAPAWIHSAESETGVIRGTVGDRETGAPVRSAVILVEPSHRRTTTGATGRYIVPGLAAGTYRVTILAIGYQPTTADSVRLTAGDTVVVDVSLAAAPIRLADLIVVPGSFNLLAEMSLPGQQTLTREDLAELPQVFEDTYRAVQRLPGATGDDFSARPMIRGGLPTDVQSELDGVRLFEPFHLKSFDGALSIIDIESVGELRVLTGGFTAEYGRAVAGVLDMKTVPTPTAGHRSAIGLSLTNLTASTAGSFGGGRGGWLVAGRRGYLDLALRLLREGQGLSPKYSDLLAKVEYRPSARHALSLHWLAAGDRLEVTDHEFVDDRSRFGSRYLWAGWSADWGRGRSSRTIISTASTDRARHGVNGSDFDRVQSFLAADTSSFSAATLRSDWQSAWSERHYTRFGFELSRVRADYDYFRWNRRIVVDPRDPSGVTASVDTTDLQFRATGTDLSGYLSHRVRFTPGVVTEIGVRTDHQSLRQETTLSPRFNLSIDLDQRTTLRIASGQFHQPQSLDQLEVADGVRDLARSERATQHNVGLIRTHGALEASLDVYHRTLPNPRSRFESLSREPETYPQDDPSRVRVSPERSRAWGGEFMVRWNARAWGGYVSAVVSRSEDRIAGRWLPRFNDQRYALRLGAVWRPTPKWVVGGGWSYHSGWPVTPQTLKIDVLPNGRIVTTRLLGAWYSERLPAYHRLDLRVTRRFPTQTGGWSVFLDVFNAYDRVNATGYSYGIRSFNGRDFVVARDLNNQLGRLPSFGVRWEF
jgi:hypothetical protein